MPSGRQARPLVFVERAGRIVDITTYPALAYSKARLLSQRTRTDVTVRLPAHAYVFARAGASTRNSNRKEVP